MTVFRNCNTRPSRSLLLAGTAAVLMAFGAATLADTSAWAAQGETSKGAMLRKQGGGNGGGAGEMRQGAGSTLEQRILRGGYSTEADEDSDRPAWAGREGDRDQTPGGGNKGADSEKGDLYGDLYIILRNASGVPILNDGGYVQPIAFTVDADGNLVPVLDTNGDYVLLPLDAEGEIDPTQIPEGANWVPAEVEFSRLSIARSPDMVISRALDEAYIALLAADEVTLDPSGRIVVTVDGEESTFDSPLINLALYEQLVTYGNLILRDDEGVPIDEEGNPVTDPADYVVLLPTSILPDSASALSQADLDLAATLFAAAADKSGTINVDIVVYMNSILGIDGTLEGDYVDYSTISYNRADAYDGVTAEVMVLQDDGVTYKVETVNILDAVFGGEDGSFDEATENLTATNADGFTAATDDALQVIEFIHAYAPPEV